MPDYYFVAMGLVEGMWGVWLVVWLVMAKGVKRTRYRQPWWQRLSYFGWGAVCVVLMEHVPALQVRVVPMGVGWCVAGVVVCGMGLGFAVWARVHLGRNWSGFVVVKEGHELIQSGPYGWVRHPIYTGILVGLFGAFLAVYPTWGAVVTMGVLTGAFWVKMRQEEKVMAGEFPEGYARFKERVRWRLVPGLI